MKLLSVNLARSIWFFPLAELNPRGRHLYQVYLSIIEKYRFTNYPATISEVDFQEGLKIQNGVFERTDKEPVSVSLTIYNEGLLAETRSSTADTDAFLEDLLNWLARDFNLSYEPGMVRAKIYVSELYIRMDHELKTLNPRLEEFSKELSSKVPGYGEISLEVSGISFWTDPNKIGRATPFRLERHEGMPFKENRYYSMAPLSTELHREMLEEFERILTS